MSLLDKIGTIVPKYDADLCLGYSIHIDSEKKKSSRLYKVEVGKKTVVIYLNSLSPKQAKSLQRAIKEEFQHGHIIIIEDTNVELIDKLYNYNDKEDNRLLAFFKDVLSAPDWEVLRDSLFLRSEFKKGNQISAYKASLIQRYGQRGNTISNLCTAGYFENPMLPLCQASKAEFYAYYDIAVNRGITALFVNYNMTIQDITDEIKRMVISAKAYGLTYMHIHGIGNNNIGKIKTFLKQNEKKMGFIVRKVFADEKLHVYVAEIIF